MTTISLPWNGPKSIYDDDGKAGTFLIQDHTFEITPVGTGIHSGRTRWKVKCATCNEVIHKSTTSASIRVRQHLEDKND